MTAGQVSKWNDLHQWGRQYHLIKHNGINKHKLSTNKMLIQTFEKDSREEEEGREGEEEIGKKDKELD